MQGDQGQAARLFAECIAVTAETGSERLLLGAVAGLAGVALALGQPVRAARMLSAVEAAGKTSGVGRLGYAAHTTRILAEAQASLPEPVFVAAWEEGRQLPLADAVAEALAIAASTEQPPPSVSGDASRPTSPTSLPSSASTRAPKPPPSRCARASSDRVASVIGGDYGARCRLVLRPSP